MDEKTLNRLMEAKALASPDLASRLDQWSDYLLFQKRYSENTAQGYFSDLKFFLEFASGHLGGNLDLQDIKNLDIQFFRAFMSHRLRSGISPRSNARALSTIKSFFKYLKRNGVSINSDIDIIAGPKLKKTLPRPISIDQASELLSHPDTDWQGKRDRALFGLLYGSGLRIGEALNIKTITFNQMRNNMISIEGKGQKERKVVILNPIAAWINEYLKELGDTNNEYLFIGSRGGQLSSAVAQKRLAYLRRQLGLPESLTPHALRHSFASHIFAKGGDLRTLQEALGHANLSSTQIYTQVDTTILEEKYKMARKFIQ